MDLNEQITDIVSALEREGALGEKFKGPRDANEVRYGKHGSLSIIVRGASKGDWFDHETKEGGGPWGLIERYTRHDVGKWLRDHHLGDEPRQASGGSNPQAVYDYVDEQGKLLFQVCRFPNHVFRQRAPDGTWKIKGIRRVLYHLPELVAAKRTGNGHPWRVYLCEGEKDCDRLRRDWGVVATCNPGGAKYWQDSFDTCFAGAEVILLEDNDDAGRARSAMLASRLATVAVSVRVVSFPNLPDKGDISDWMDEGGSQSSLEDIIDGIDPVGIEPPEPVEPIWSTHYLPDWDGLTIPERQWIFPDWIPFRQTTGLYGVGGVLKTTWLLQLMMAASAGLHFCGHKITKVPVFGLFCEDTAEEILRRVSRIAQFYNHRLADFADFHFASLVGVMDTELMIWDYEKGGKKGPALDFFEDQLKNYQPGLVVLDTLPDFFGGSEIDRRQTSHFVRLIDNLSIRFNCAILASAHPSQSGRRSGRFESGNTGIEGKMRARLSLHDPGDDPDEPENDNEREKRAHHIAIHPTDKRILTRQKSNYAKPGEEIPLIIKDGAFFPAALDPNQPSGYMRDLACRAKFKEILRAVIDEGGYVSDTIRSGPRNFAPRRFAPHPLNRATGFASRDFAKAMDALLADKEIRIDRNRKHVQLVFV